MTARLLSFRLTRRECHEARQGATLGVVGMLVVWFVALLLTAIVGTCAHDPAYAQVPPPDGTVAPSIQRIPVLSGVRFAWPTPAVRAQLVALWRDGQEFGACVTHVAVFAKDTVTVRQEIWIIDSVVPAIVRVANHNTLIESVCPPHTIGFIHSHPDSRVCNLSPGDLVAGALFQFAVAGVVCGPDGAIGFAFNPLLPAIAPSDSAAPAARLPPDTSAHTTGRVPPAPDEGYGS